MPKIHRTSSAIFQKVINKLTTRNPPSTTRSQQACRREARKGCARKHVKSIAPQHNHSGSHRLSESLIIVVEGSVQLVSTSLAFQLPQNVGLSCCDACICNYTVTNRCFSGPTRGSLPRWFLPLQTSLSFKLRFVVKHMFHRSKHRLHLVSRQTRNAASFRWWYFEGMRFNFCAC